MHKPIKGFSKLSKEGKIEWLVNELFENPDAAWATLRSYWHDDARVQKLHDELIENTITNYYLPFGVAPNFKINGKMYTIPMAIEESSVVAAAAKSAQFWMDRGGFKSTIISTTKIGHVHFMYNGDAEKLYQLVEEIKPQFFEDTNEITANMRARGGGILSIDLRNKTDELDNYYQLEVRFETCDSMGANFINCCLDQFAKTIDREVQAADQIRIHGDCHVGNILWRDDTAHFVDLDDCCTAPAVQDLWMFLSGDRPYRQLQLAELIEGYSEFCDFDPRQLRWIEALRTMRLTHYAAWLARRWSDPAFPRSFTWFNTERYWADHILELREQMAALAEEPLQLL